MSLPSHLAQNQAQGLTPGQLIAQFELGDYDNFVYLVVDWTSREAAMVDCRLELGALETALKQHDLCLTQLWLTHSHWDHVHGLGEFIRKFPGVPIWIHPEEKHRLNENLRHYSELRELSDEQKFLVGAVEVQVMHTPGHSAGECCFFIPTSGTQPPYLLSGDTLFIRDCGRTNLPGGSDQQMFESLQRIKRLPMQTVILPGHHYHPTCASTLDVELRENGPLRCESAEELARMA